MKLGSFLSRRVWVVALVLCLASVAVHGLQQAPAGAGVTIDFIAVTADGKPVTDLNPSDLAVRIGGKARTVSALTLKKIEATALPVEATGNASPPFFTNPPIAAGRSILIVVDTESLRPGTEIALKEAIENLLKNLTPADRVAFSVLPTDTAQIGFGTPLPRVREAVAKLAGQRGSDVGSPEALCRTSNSLNMLKSLLDPLAGNESPTAVVFAAASLSLPGRTSEKDSRDSGTARCEVLQDQYRAVGIAAAAGRANFYVVQGDVGVMDRNDGLDNLAGVTGAGQVLRVVNEGFAPRVLADSSAYWVATVAADPSDRPGQAQRLEVRTTRENVTIHARAEFAISKQAAQAKSGTVSPSDMLKTTAPFTDLQLRALAYHARGEADKMTVLVMAEPVDPAVKIAAMRIGFFDQSGKGSSTNPPQIATYPITTALPLNAGPYRIRVAATDASGKSGAVDVNIDTNLTQAGPLKLGGLMLGAPTEKGMSPRLLFSGEDKIQVMFELYGVITADAKMKVGFEVASSDTGPTTTAYQPSAASQLQPDKFAIFGEIPIDKLAPGDYVIRAVAQLEGQPEGKVLRTFRKVAK